MAQQGEGAGNGRRDMLTWRLRSAEGHVAGIARMLEQGTPCLDVIRQIHAVQCALREVARLMLIEQLCAQLAEADREPGSARERMLAEVGELLKFGS